MFERRKPESSAPPRSCPACGCRLDSHGWRQCPRCRHELPGCTGCGQCKCGG